MGCPKLDDVDYSEKLTEILRQNDIQKCADRTDGGSMLWRLGACSKDGIAKQRQDDSMAGKGNLYGWKASLNKYRIDL